MASAAAPTHDDEVLFQATRLILLSGIENSSAGQGRRMAADIAPLGSER
jgi:hypothetical protein